MKFYPSDCSLSARGLWIEMLNIMHESTPRGELSIDGNPVAMKDLASLVNTPLEDVETSLSELESQGVFSRKENGIIYSREMVRRDM